MLENDSVGGGRIISGGPGLMHNRSRKEFESKAKETWAKPSNQSSDHLPGQHTLDNETDSESVIFQQIGGLGDKKKRKAKHKALKPISKKHPEYELAYDMMLGIRTVVGRAEGGLSNLEDAIYKASTSPNTKEAELLVKRFRDDFVGQVSPDKFTEAPCYRFPKKGGQCTPPHCMKSFNFKDYCPEIFKMLRQLFNIDPSDYQTEVCGNYQYLEFMSNSKSGQFFFYSHNQRFMVKTMTKTEAKLLRKILPQYYSYIRKHPHSLLAKFFGMHRVKPHRRDHIYFLIMGSVFYSKEGLEIHEQYDLKGSRKNRKAGASESMMKDLDLIENKIYLNIGRDKKKLFRQQLLSDTEFLRKNKIMDYSLLVGIHYRNRKHTSPLKELSCEVKECKEMVDVDSFSLIEIGRAETTPIKNIIRPDINHTLKKDKQRRSLLNPRLKNHYKLSKPRADLFIVPEIVPHEELGKLVKDNLLKHPGEAKSQDGSGLESENESSMKNPFTDTCGGMCYRHPEDGTLGNEIYFTGVIDLLQQFNRRKKVESFFKSRMNNPEIISAVDPEIYSRRFNRFIEERLM